MAKSNVPDAFDFPEFDVEVDEKALERASLNETMRPFVARHEQSKYELVAEETSTGKEAVEANLNGLKALLKEEGLVKSESDKDVNASYMMALAIGIGNLYSKGYGRSQKSVKVKPQKNPFKESKIADFKLNIKKETVDEILGDYPPKDGESETPYYKFKTSGVSKYDIQSTKYNLLNHAYLQLSVPGERESEDDKQKRLVKVQDILKEMGKFNPAAHLSEIKREVKQEIHFENVRKMNSSMKVDIDFVTAPILGSKMPDANDKVQLLKSLGNHAYGTQACSRTLYRVYEAARATICARELSDQGAYDLMSFILSGEILAHMENAQRTNVPFKKSWYTSQMNFTKTESTSDVINQLKRLLGARPHTANNHIAKISNLVHKKNRNLPPKERDFMIRYEEREYIQALLQHWYPEYYVTAKQRYEAIIETASNLDVEPDTPMIVYSNICSDLLRGVTPRPAANAGGAAVVNAFETTMTEESLVDELREENRETREMLEMNTMPSEINAFEGNGNKFKNNTPNAPPSKPKLPAGFKIPPHLQGCCVSCAKSDHRFSDCVEYPNLKLAERECSYCGGYHYGTCNNQKSNVMALEHSGHSEEPNPKSDALVYHPEQNPTA